MIPNLKLIRADDQCVSISLRHSDVHEPQAQPARQSADNYESKAYTPQPAAP